MTASKEFVEPIEQLNLNLEDHSSFEWFTAEDAVNRRDEIVPQEHVSYEHEDDPEYLTILRGFELNGKELNLG